MKNVAPEANSPTIPSSASRRSTDPVSSAPRVRSCGPSAARTCVRTSRPSDAPIERAASTNGRDRARRVSLPMYSAISGHPTSASEPMNPMTPKGRVTSTSMTASNSCGTAGRPRRWGRPRRRRSPPYHPETIPMITPSTKRTSVATTTIASVSHAPERMRDHWSRPSASVPRRWSAAGIVGGTAKTRVPSGSVRQMSVAVAPGSSGASAAPKAPRAMSNPIATSPRTSGGLPRTRRISSGTVMRPPGSGRGPRRR